MCRTRHVHAVGHSKDIQQVQYLSRENQEDEPCSLVVLSEGQQESARRVWLIVEGSGKQHIGWRACRARGLQQRTQGLQRAVALRHGLHERLVVRVPFLPAGAAPARRPRGCQCHVGVAGGWATPVPVHMQKMLCT